MNNGFQVKSDQKIYRLFVIKMNKGLPNTLYYKGCKFYELELLQTEDNISKERILARYK